jgi:hypothetical protein
MSLQRTTDSSSSYAQSASAAIPPPSLGDLIARLETLEAQIRTATAPLDARLDEAKARVKALEAQRTVQIEAFTFERDSLQAAIRLVVQAQRIPQVKTAGFTVTYTERVHWDDAGLQAYAEEQPSVLQFRQVTPSTLWRWK